MIQAAALCRGRHTEIKYSEGATGSLVVLKSKVYTNDSGGRSVFATCHSAFGMWWNVSLARA
jgi:hypothetical protein